MPRPNNENEFPAGGPDTPSIPPSSSASNNKAASVIQLNNTDDTNSYETARKIGHWIALILTTIAMIPQGLFGGLYMLKLLRLLGLTDFVGLPIAALIAFSAARGKVRIVSFYNTQDFEKYAIIINKLLKQEPLAEDEKLTVKVALESLLTLFPSITFGYLAWLSLEDSAALLREFNFKASDVAADIISNAWFESVFILPAIGSNIPGFINIHRGAKAKVFNMFYYLAENSGFRRQRHSVEEKIKNVRSFYVKEIEEMLKNDRHLSGDILEDNMLAKATAFLSELLENEYIEKTNITGAIKTANDEIPVKTLVEYILQYNQQNRLGESISKQSWKAFFTMHFAGLLGTAAGVYGLINFIDMGKRAAGYVVIPALTTTFGRFTMASMSALALASIYDLAIHFFEAMFGRNPSLNLDSTKSKFKILAVAITVCMLGGTPNAFQSYIDGESVVAQAFAVLASFLIELYGYYMVSTRNKKVSIENNSENKKVLYEIDALFEKTINKLYELQTAKTGNKLTNILRDPDLAGAGESNNSDIAQYRDMGSVVSYVTDLGSTVKYAAGRISYHAYSFFCCTRKPSGTPEEGAGIINGSPEKGKEPEWKYPAVSTYGTTP